MALRGGAGAVRPRPGGRWGAVPVSAVFPPPVPWSGPGGGGRWGAVPVPAVFPRLSPGRDREGEGERALLVGGEEDGRLLVLCLLALGVGLLGLRLLEWEGILERPLRSGGLWWGRGPLGERERLVLERWRSLPLLWLELGCRRPRPRWEPTEELLCRLPRESRRGEGDLEELALPLEDLERALPLEDLEEALEGRVTLERTVLWGEGEGSWEEGLQEPLEKPLDRPLREGGDSPRASAAATLEESVLATPSRAEPLVHCRSGSRPGVAGASLERPCWLRGELWSEASSLRASTGGGGGEESEGEGPLRWSLLVLAPTAPAGASVSSRRRVGVRVRHNACEQGKKRVSPLVNVQGFTGTQEGDYMRIKRLTDR